MLQLAIAIQAQNTPSCSALTSVIIPAGVTSIESQAFFHCDSVTSLELPTGLTNIGDEAFYATGLTHIDALSAGDSWTPEFLILGYGGDDISGVVTIFSSSKKDVAYFEEGVLKIAGPGTTTITCQTYNARKATFRLTVR